MDGHRYGHIVDPRTGWPADSGCDAAWVVAPSCTEAGILSTAAIVLGVEEGMGLIEGAWRAAGCLWTDRGVHCSRRMHDYFIEALQ
jgi:thiamine biosynthesis lipoprotein